MPTLNIKDPEVYRLAADLAARRGTSMTGAVRAALAEAVEREQTDSEERVERILEIAARMRARGLDDMLTDDDLYDENGLPT
ncbi:MAG: type II toxin-antitoxin system VapB family antitoxin [Nocardioides sp.]